MLILSAVACLLIIKGSSHKTEENVLRIKIISLSGRRLKSKKASEDDDRLSLLIGSSQGVARNVAWRILYISALNILIVLFPVVSYRTFFCTSYLLPDIDRKFFFSLSASRTFFHPRTWKLLINLTVQFPQNLKQFFTQTRPHSWVKRFYWLLCRLLTSVLLCMKHGMEFCLLKFLLFHLVHETFTRKLLTNIIKISISPPASSINNIQQYWPHVQYTGWDQIGD